METTWLVLTVLALLLVLAWSLGFAVYCIQKMVNIIRLWILNRQVEKLSKEVDELRRKYTRMSRKHDWEKNLLWQKPLQWGIVSPSVHTKFRFKNGYGVMIDEYKEHLTMNLIYFTGSGEYEYEYYHLSPAWKVGRNEIGEIERIDKLSPVYDKELANDAVVMLMDWVSNLPPYNINNPQVI